MADQNLLLEGKSYLSCYFFIFVKNCFFEP